MIDRRYNEIAFTCDACGEVLYTCEPEWADAKRELDDAGWVARLDDGEWTHLCLECQ